MDTSRLAAAAVVPPPQIQSAPPLDKAVVYDSTAVTTGPDGDVPNSADWQDVGLLTHQCWPEGNECPHCAELAQQPAAVAGAANLRNWQSQIHTARDCPPDDYPQFLSDRVHSDRVHVVLGLLVREYRRQLSLVNPPDGAVESAESAALHYGWKLVDAQRAE